MGDYMQRISFYELMDLLDRFSLDYAEDYDFRDLTVHCNKILDREIIFLKDKNNEIVTVINLDDRPG